MSLRLWWWALWWSLRERREIKRIERELKKKKKL
jgi:hypothetical protein